MKKIMAIIMAFMVFFLFVVVRAEYALAASDLETGIDELAEQISKNMKETGRKKIAIVEFSDLDGNITAFGQFLAEELITRLFMIAPGQFEVVERRQLMRVLQEQKLTMSGLLDAKAMESVGKILGIDAIVTGTVADLGNTVKINARLIGVDTARVFAVAATSIPKVGTVASLLEKEASPIPVYSSTTEGSSKQNLPMVSARSRRGSAPSFQNSFLRVTVQSVSKSKDKTTLTMVLTFENIARDDIFLAIQEMPKKEGGVRVNLIDERGKIWQITKITGIQTLWFSFASLGGEYYTIFNPKAKNTIIMVFKTDEASDGKIFSFSADLFRYFSKSKRGRRGHAQFSIGISDIRI